MRLVKFPRGVRLFLCADPDPRGLECCALQWHGENQPLGLPLLRRPHDLWQLRTFQPAGRHSGRGIFRRGKALTHLSQPETNYNYQQLLFFTILNTISRNILFSYISLNFYTCTGFILLLHNPHSIYLITSHV